MRSLLVTPVPTHPTIAGNRARVRQVGEALARHGPVDLLYVPLDGSPAEDLCAMRAAWNTLYVADAAPPRARRRAPDHWGVDEWITPSSLAAARFLARSVRYGVVVVSYVFCSLLLEPFRGVAPCRVLDTHDRFGGRHVAAVEAGLSPHWFSTIATEEARGLARADVVLAIQDDEAAHFRSLTSVPVAVAHYAPPPRFLAERRSRRLVVGYLGSDNPANCQNIAAFDTALAGALDPATAELVSFRLMGGVADALPDLRRFRPAGRFDDPADAYEELDLVINPERGGTGLKIKTVEALAHGRPILSTRAGGAGLQAIHPDLGHLDQAAVLVRLLALLRDRSLMPPIARAQRQGYERFQAAAQGRLDALVADWVGR